MDFELTEEQELFRRMVRQFADREIAPKAAYYDRSEEFPVDNVRKMAEIGLMGLMVPEEYGGPGGTAIEYVIAMEEIARACAATSVIMSVNVSLVCDPIVKFGTEEQKRRFLPDLAAARMIGAYCLSEPSSGSDAASISTRAVRDGDHYVISGTKNFITNGGVAGVYLVYAATDPSARARGVSAFLVQAETPGLRAGRREEKLGIRASATTQVFFEECRIPAANLLGREGEGFKIAVATLDGGRVGIAAQAVGIARAAYEAALAWAKERRAFGQPVAGFQGIQWMLADMATRIEAARLLTWRAAAMKERGRRFTREASMAKLYASETAVWVTNKALQIHGGYGYMRDYPVERYFRDAKITEIYEGTSEIQRLVIARQVLQE